MSRKKKQQSIIAQSHTASKQRGETERLSTLLFFRTVVKYA